LGNIDSITARSFPKSGLMRKKSCATKSALKSPAFCRMAMDNGPQVVLGSEKRALLMKTDICLLCS